MHPTKDEIKSWLKKTGHSREWLGQQCGGISKRAVDNWLSSPKEIPSGSLSLISRLMIDDAASEIQRAQLKLPANQIFSLEVSLDDFRSYSRAALAAGLTLEDWAIEECNRAANQAAALHEQAPEIPRYWIDLCGGIAAGTQISSDCPHEPIAVNKNYGEDCYALRVFGESMSPKVPDGSLIVVKRLPEGIHPKKDAVVVYADAYGLTLKVFGYRAATEDEEGNAFGKLPILKSINPKFPQVITMDGGNVEAVLVEVI